MDIENGDIKKVFTKDNTYDTKTIIIATGCGIRKLGLANEDELFGKGVSYCATCDGAFFKDKCVAVVGGGNTALEEALYLSEIASKVYLIHRRDSFRGEDRSVSEIKKKKNIEIIYNSNVTKLNGMDNLSSIEVTDKDNNTRDLEVNALFVAIGRIPENANFARVIDIDSAGYVVAGEDCKTNVDGIFVAGDARVKSLRQLVTATGDGAVAATNAIKYINGR